MAGVEYLQIMQHSHYGNKYLEKIAVDWGSMAEWAMHHAQVGGAIHIGQNIATDRVLKNAPVYHKLFSDYFHAGLQGHGYPGKAHVPKRMSAFGNESEFAPMELGQEAQHLAGTGMDSSYIKPTGSWTHRLLGKTNPELQMMLEEAHKAGHEARSGLLAKPSAAVSKTKQYSTGLLDLRSGDPTQRRLAMDNIMGVDSPRARAHAFASDMEGRGISSLESRASQPADIYKHMGRRSAAIYARALRGDFAHLHDMAQRYPGLKDEIRSHLYEVEKRTTHPVTTILDSRQRALDVEKAYKENPVTGNLMASLAAKPRDMSTAKDNFRRRGTSLYEGAAMMGVWDPFAGALNATKLALSDHPQVLSKSPKLQAAADWLSNKVVKNPLANASNQGFEEGSRHKWYYGLSKKMLMNNAVGQVEDAANSIAYQAGKHTKGIRKALSVGEDVQ